MPWSEVYKLLKHFAERHDCVPPKPPKPLILNGWVFSNDIEKGARWKKTVQWADNNGCKELVDRIQDKDFYFVDEPSTYEIGPMGGPMYRSWDFETKNRPSPEALKGYMEILLTRWPEIAGKELSIITRPVVFTGNKARRLLVKADAALKPPWGGWCHLSNVESERRAFTSFRASVNEAISPHEVDHIDFIADEIAEQSAPADAGTSRR